MYKNIVTEVDNGVGIVTLNRPDRNNAFDSQTVGELNHALAGMAGDDAVRVVVLSSSGKSFCAGADLEWMRVATHWTSAENEADARVLAEMLHRLATLPKPTVVRVQGAAHGIGVGMIAACDIAVATFDTQFALADVKHGLIPAAVAPHLIAAIGERHARRYMLTAERFSAAEAYRLGLVHEMVADQAALDQALGDIVDSLLGNGPGALTECKDLVRAVRRHPLDGALIAETARRIARVRASEEGRYGVAAFLEGRQPNWIE